MTTLVIKSDSEENIRLLFDLARKIGEKPVIENRTVANLRAGIAEAKDIVAGKRKAKNIKDIIDGK